jgi:hypothetical protein
MPELLHHVGRVLADRDQDRGERVAQLVRGDPERQGCRPRSLAKAILAEGADQHKQREMIIGLRLMTSDRAPLRGLQASASSVGLSPEG